MMMLPDELVRMRSASTKAYFDMLVSELSNRIEIPLGFDFSVLQARTKFVQKNSIFGANLTSEGICQMNQLIDHICSSEYIIVEGLFRKSGSRARQNELVEHLAPGNLEIDLNKSAYSIHDVCCVLKRFISELPEPLLTQALTELFFETLNIKSATHRVDVIRLLILLLPEANQTFVYDLFKMFDKITKNSSKNLMTSANLSTIFAPMFFFTSDTSAEKLKDSLGQITQCLKIMIDNSDAIFTPPKTILVSAKTFMEKWNASNKLMSTTSLIPHARMCATTAANEPSDYTKQQMALLFAELQKTVNDKDSKKKKKKFSEKRQKELLSQVTNQNVFGTPLVKLERDKRQQELIKQQMNSKKHGQPHGLKEFGSTIKKKFFTPKKYQIQGSATFIAKKRKSMDFKESLMDPKSSSSSQQNTPTVASQTSNCRNLRFSTPTKSPSIKTIKSSAESSPSVFNQCNLSIDIPPPLPPKPTPKPTATQQRRRHSNKPRRSSIDPRSISTITMSCQKENRARNASTKSLPARQVVNRMSQKSRVRGLIAKHEAFVVSAKKSPEPECEYVSLSHIPIPSSSRPISRSTKQAFNSKSLLFGPHTAL